MSVYRNCAFFRSDDNPNGFYVQRSSMNSKTGDYPVDFILYENCVFSQNFKDKILRVTDRANGNTYISHPGWDSIQ